jgi:hypothetical protein
MTQSMSKAGGLAARSCKACAGETHALSDAEVQKFLADVPGWERHGKEIVKTFPFKNYYQTMAFVNATAWISHRKTTTRIWRLAITNVLCATARIPSEDCPKVTSSARPRLNRCWDCESALWI